VYSQLFYLNILIDDHHQAGFSFLNIEIFVKFSNQIKKLVEFTLFIKKFPFFHIFSWKKLSTTLSPCAPSGAPKKKKPKRKTG